MASFLITGYWKKNTSLHNALQGSVCIQKFSRFNSHIMRQSSSDWRIRGLDQIVLRRCSSYSTSALVWPSQQETLSFGNISSDYYYTSHVSNWRCSRIMPGYCTLLCWSDSMVDYFGFLRCQVMLKTQMMRVCIPSNQLVNASFIQ